jgi:TRAP-type C4-dicarboxylate transport system substrate-binding protein
MASQRFTRAAVGLGITTVLLLTSGGALRAGDDDKAGGDDDPVVLTMADLNSLTNPAVQRFVDEVAELSDGELRVDVTNAWGHWAPDVEQQVVRDVAAGEADLGVVWTHTFDMLGVDAFRALNAPMLIDSYPLQKAVLGSELPGEMLAELDALGVTGLAVLADGLYKPIAVDHPLLSPADYAGITFSSRRSTTHEQSILALGAWPEVAIGAVRDGGVGSGAIDGFEMTLLFSTMNPGLFLAAPYVTANVDLWANPLALIANPDRLAGLTEGQRDIVTRAAMTASEQSSGIVDRDAELLAELCGDGVRFANASDDDLVAMREAFAPVYETLELDAQTADFIARIEELKAATDPGPALDVPSECTGVSPLGRREEAGNVEPATEDDAADLDGIYRWTLTAEDDLAHGTPGDRTAERLAVYPQVFTVTLDNGTWTMRWEAADGTTSVECDRCPYTVDGDTVSFEWGPGELSFTYSVDDDSNLSLEMLPPIQDGEVFVWTTKTWERID